MQTVPEFLLRHTGFRGMLVAPALTAADLMSRSIHDTFIAPPCHEDYTLLYEDDAILVVNKPSGLLSLSGKDPANWDSLHYRLVQTYPEALLIHRLDFGTSGIVLVARGKPIAKKLYAQFQNQHVEKKYQAIVDGHIEDTSQEIRFAIARDDAQFPRMQLDEHLGKPSLTELHVAEYLDSPIRTRVNLLPKTGRTHQLRVHCAAIGHPILGDDLYGDDRTHQAANRLQLHAGELSFEHPVSGKTLTVQSPCPF